MDAVPLCAEGEVLQIAALFLLCVVCEIMRLREGVHVHNSMDEVSNDTRGVLGVFFATVRWRSILLAQTASVLDNNGNIAVQDALDLVRRVPQSTVTGRGAAARV